MQVIPTHGSAISKQIELDLTVHQHVLIISLNTVPYPLGMII
jgi:hypothetical protein